MTWEPMFLLRRVALGHVGALLAALAAGTSAGAAVDGATSYSYFDEQEVWVELLTDPDLLRYLHL